MTFASHAFITVIRSASLNLGVQIGTCEFNAWVTLRLTRIPSGGVKIFLVA